ncbi:MAG: acyl carrier protein [Deltaproteobacteria bacterium]|nr:acyl carrier protein [Deltaproteobacteria bacterium]
MNEAEILHVLLETIVRFFGDASLTIGAETVAADVPGWDSLANVELMVEIEDAFGVRFRTGEVASLASVGDLAALIGRRVAR